MPRLQSLVSRDSALRGLALLGTLVVIWRASTSASSLGTKLVGALVGLLLVLVLRRRIDLVVPGTVLAGILVPVLPSALLSFGVPLAVVRPYTYYKDLAVVVVLSCLVDREQRRAGPLDAVERWGLALIGLVSLYTLLPIASAGADALAFNIRTYGWRFDLEWVIFLLAVRRLVLPPRTTTYLVRVLGLVTVLEIGVTVYEKLSPTAWSDFLTNTIQVPTYMALAQGGGSSLITDINHFGTGKALRVGGLTISSVGTGFIMVILVATLAPYAAATVLNRKRILLLGGALLALSLTLTRSSVLSAVVLMLFVFFLPARRRTAGTTRAMLLAVLGLLAAVPSLVNSNLIQRTSSALSGADPSAEAHGQGSSTAFTIALHHLFGFGVGTNPNVANRFGVVTLTAEDTFLQTALELGLLGVTLLAGLLVSLIVSNVRTHRALDGSALHLGAAAAAVGITVQSFFLEPFSDLSTAFLFAALLGVAQPLRRPPASTDVDDYARVLTQR